MILAALTFAVVLMTVGMYLLWSELRGLQSRVMRLEASRTSLKDAIRERALELHKNSPGRDLLRKRLEMKRGNQ